MFNKNKKKELKYTTASGHQGDGDWIDNCKFTRRFDEADIIVFEGGQDISCSLYGEKRGIHTQTGEHLSTRDLQEIDLYKKSVDNDKLIISICRGHQLCAVLNGASLIQHVNNHSGYHQVKNFDGTTCVTNSIHHQMVNPWKLNKEKYLLLQWTEGISNTYLNGENQEIEFSLEAFTDEGLIKEVESLYFPDTKCLTFQHHPEMLGYNRGWSWNIQNQDDIHTLDYLNNIIKQIIEDEKSFVKTYNEIVKTNQHF